MQSLYYPIKEYCCFSTYRSLAGDKEPIAHRTRSRSGMRLKVELAQEENVNRRTSAQYGS